MRTRGLAAVAVTICLAGCSSADDVAPEPTTPDPTTTEAPAETNTPTGSPEEVWVQNFAAQWNTQTDEEKAGLCESWETLGAEATHEALEAPEVVSVETVDSLFSQLC